MIIRNINKNYLERKVKINHHDIDINLYLQPLHSMYADNLFLSLKREIHPTIFIPSLDFFIDKDFYAFEEKIKNEIPVASNLLYLNNNLIQLESHAGIKYKVYGSLFWNDFEGLNEELIIFSLLKNKIYQQIKANSWFDISSNKEKFSELNEKLSKNNTYYQINKKHYKDNHFHPIISYLLYLENMEKISQHFSMKEENTEHIIISHNTPLNTSIFFNNIQTDLQGSEFYQTLNKSFDLEKYSSMKYTFENDLKNFSIDTLIHNKNNEKLFYYYKNTKVFGLSEEMNDFDISFQKSLEIQHITSTINLFLKENKNYLDYIKELIINPKPYEMNNKYLLDLIKSYNLLCNLIYHISEKDSRYFDFSTINFIKLENFKINISKEKENIPLQQRNLYVKNLLYIFSQNVKLLERLREYILTIE